MSFVAGRSPRFRGRCCRARSCPTIGGNAATGRRLIPGGGTSPHPLTHPPPHKQEVVINSLNTITNTQIQIQTQIHTQIQIHKHIYSTFSFPTPSSSRSLHPILLNPPFPPSDYIKPTPSIFFDPMLVPYHPPP